MFAASTTIAVFDWRDVADGLDAMERRARALLPVFQELKAPLRADQKEHRKDKASPDGTWAPRSAATLASRSHRKLARSLLGRLPTAVSYKATPYAVTGESRVKWSAAHQDGATVGRGARLVARVFLWISEKLLAIAEGVFEGALVNAYDGVR